MGPLQDKVLSDSTYNRKMNAIELEKQRALMQLEAELLLNFQTDIRKIEAELIKTRMLTQSSLFEKFIDFMKETLKTNDALIAQQTRLYEISAKSDTKCEFFLDRAEKVDILSAKQLIEIGAEKVKELNLESSKEMQYLEARLEKVLGIAQDDSHLAITN